MSASRHKVKRWLKIETSARSVIGIRPERYGVYIFSLRFTYVRSGACIHPRPYGHGFSARKYKTPGVEIA